MCLCDNLSVGATIFFEGRFEDEINAPLLDIFSVFSEIYTKSWTIFFRSSDIKGPPLRPDYEVNICLKIVYNWVPNPQNVGFPGQF